MRQELSPLALFSGRVCIRIGITSFLNVWEFSSKPIQAWSFLYEAFNEEFNFFVRYKLYSFFFLLFVSDLVICVFHRIHPCHLKCRVYCIKSFIFKKSPYDACGVCSDAPSSISNDQSSYSLNTSTELFKNNLVSWVFYIYLVHFLFCLILLFFYFLSTIYVLKV